MKKYNINIFIKLFVSYFIIFLVRLIFPIDNFSNIDFMFGMIHGFTTFYWLEKLDSKQKVIKITCFDSSVLIRIESGRNKFGIFTDIGFISFNEIKRIENLGYIKD